MAQLLLWPVCYTLLWLVVKAKWLPSNYSSGGLMKWLSSNCQTMSRSASYPAQSGLLAPLASCCLDSSWKHNNQPSLLLSWRWFMNYSTSWHYQLTSMSISPKCSFLQGGTLKATPLNQTVNWIQTLLTFAPIAQSYLFSVGSIVSSMVKAESVDGW